jgi:hypothetical protein
MAIVGCAELYWNHFRETFSKEPDYGYIYPSMAAIGDEPAPFKAQREVNVDNKSKEKHHKERPGHGIVLLWEAKHIISHYKAFSKKKGRYEIFQGNEANSVPLGKFIVENVSPLASWVGSTSLDWRIEDTDGNVLYRISNDSSCLLSI